MGECSFSEEKKPCEACSTIADCPGFGVEHQQAKFLRFVRKGKFQKR